MGCGCDEEEEEEEGGRESCCWKRCGTGVRLVTGLLLSASFELDLTRLA